MLRIIQEACSNAIRHADCSIIKVVLNYQPGTIILSIEDDGKGFAYEETECSCKADNSGFGLSKGIPFIWKNRHSFENKCGDENPG